MLAHEGVSERGDTWALGPSLCTQAGRKFRVGPEVLGSESSGQVPAGFRAIQRVGALGAGLDSRAVGSGKVGRSGGRKFRAFQKLVLASSSFSSSMLGLGPWILHGRLGCT